MAWRRYTSLHWEVPQSAARLLEPPPPAAARTSAATPSRTPPAAGAAPPAPPAARCAWLGSAAKTDGGGAVCGGRGRKHPPGNARARPHKANVQPTGWTHTQQPPPSAHCPRPTRPWEEWRLHPLETLSDCTPPPPPTLAPAPSPAPTPPTLVPLTPTLVITPTNTPLQHRRHFGRHTQRSHVNMSKFPT
jgi:hypothetical protein